MADFSRACPHFSPARSLLRPPNSHISSSGAHLNYPALLTMQEERPSKRKIDHVQDPSSSSSKHGIKPTDSFSQLFNLPNADVLLRTSDGALFAVRKAVLVAHSSVLEHMFDIPQPLVAEDQAQARHPDQQAPGTLPLVQMSETAAQLEVYLCWIHQETHKRIYHAFTKHWLVLSSQSEELYWLLDSARKYETVTITETVVGALIWQNRGAWPETALALGVLFERRDVVEPAIRRWVGASRSNAAEYAIHRIWPCLVNHLPARVFPHITHSVQRTAEDHLAQIEAEVEDQQILFAEGLPLGLKQRAWTAVVDAKCKVFMDAYDQGFPPL